MVVSNHDGVTRPFHRAAQPLRSDVAYETKDTRDRPRADLLAVDGFLDDCYLTVQHGQGMADTDNLKWFVTSVEHEYFAAESLMMTVHAASIVIRGASLAELLRQVTTGRPKE